MTQPFSPVRRTLVAITMGATALAVTAQSHAQENTTFNQATITTGFAPGGSSDTVARLLAEYLTGRYADTVVVEGKVGASGRLALEHVKNADKDGSELLVSPSGMFVLFPHIYEDLRYDSLNDFTPVTRLAKFPFLFVISDMVPQDVDTLEAFIEWGKANPELSSFGSPGAGTSAHFSGIMLGQLADFQLEHAAYRGMAPLVTDLIGGHVAAGVITPADVLPHMGTGKLRLLATTGAERSQFTPDVPTYTELGYPEILIEESYSLYAPADIPMEKRNDLAKLSAEMLKQPNVQARYEEMGLEPAASSPEAFAEYLQQLHDRWEGIVASSGFMPNQ